MTRWNFLDSMSKYKTCSHRSQRRTKARLSARYRSNSIT